MEDADSVVWTATTRWGESVGILALHLEEEARQYTGLRLGVLELLSTPLERLAQPVGIDLLRSALVYVAGAGVDAVKLIIPRMCTASTRQARIHRLRALEHLRRSGCRLGTSLHALDRRFDRVAHVEIGTRVPVLQPALSPEPLRDPPHDRPHCV